MFSNPFHKKIRQNRSNSKQCLWFLTHTGVSTERHYCVLPAYAKPKARFTALLVVKSFLFFVTFHVYIYLSRRGSCIQGNSKVSRQTLYGPSLLYSTSPRKTSSTDGKASLFTQHFSFRAVSCNVLLYSGVKFLYECYQGRLGTCSVTDQAELCSEANRSYILFFCSSP